MSFGRSSLIFAAVAFFAFGSAFLLFPNFMASLISMELSVPSAVIDVRATYGGFVIGMAAFFALCSAQIRGVLMARPVDAVIGIRGSSFSYFAWTSDQQMS